MDRKELLKKVLVHLDEAVHLMNEAGADDNDPVWNGLMAVHGSAEVELNIILIDEIQKESR